jgi:hypothetical protein
MAVAREAICFKRCHGSLDGVNVINFLLFFFRLRLDPVVFLRFFPPESSPNGYNFSTTIDSEQSGKEPGGASRDALSLSPSTD